MILGIIKKDLSKEIYMMDKHLTDPWLSVVNANNVFKHKKEYYKHIENIDSLESTLKGMVYNDR